MVVCVCKLVKEPPRMVMMVLLVVGRSVESGATTTKKADCVCCGAFCFRLEGGFWAAVAAVISSSPKKRGT